MFYVEVKRVFFQEEKFNKLKFYYRVREVKYETEVLHNNKKHQ